MLSRPDADPDRASGASGQQPVRPPHYRRAGPDLPAPDREVPIAAPGAAARLAAVRRTSLGAGADTALDGFAGLVSRVLRVPLALVTLLDDETQYFPGQRGLPEPWAGSRAMPLEDSFCQHVLDTERRLVIDDVAASPLVRDLESVTSLGIAAYAGAPITDAAGVVLGSLCAISDVPRAWTEDELALLDDLAQACSSELRLRTAVAAGQAALARVALLGEVTRAVVTTLDAEDAVARLARLVVPALGDWCTAGLVDDAGGLGRLTSKHRDPRSAPDVAALAELQAVASKDLSTPTAQVLRTGEAVLLEGEAAARMVGVAAAPLVALAPTSVLVVPLRARDGALGQLTLGRSGDSPGYGEAELHDAVDIGRRTGLALDNAEMFRRERSHGEALQRALLTRLPEPDHLQVVARYEPAAEQAQIGGDWYDAFLQPDGATVLVVGDVMGHDMTAAAMMGQVRSLVRGIAYDRTDSPAALLARVDRSFRALHLDTLATAVVARVEQDDEDLALGRCRLRWSNAGHPPPVLLAADGTVRLLETRGELLLGIEPDQRRTDHDTVLGAGDTVLLYTDGLVERRDSPLDHGLARLRRALTGQAGLSLDQLCDHLLSRMLPQRADDDVALLAVRADAPDRPRPPGAGPERPA